ncbi:ATP-binding cassette domain-containing protein [Planosporangium mesophilum]|nr:ATP-binding cassette domain-containing protein [Planosporangium mesophilum]
MVGLNGSGKSTLLRLMAGDTAADHFEIANSRVDLWTGDIQDRRTKRAPRRVSAGGGGGAHRSRR